MIFVAVASVLAVAAVACAAMFLFARSVRGESEAARAHVIHLLSLAKGAHPKELEATAEQVFGPKEIPPPPPPPSDVDEELETFQ